MLELTFWQSFYQAEAKAQDWEATYGQQLLAGAVDKGEVTAAPPPSPFPLSLPSPSPLPHSLARLPVRCSVSHANLLLLDSDFPFLVLRPFP